MNAFFLLTSHSFDTQGHFEIHLYAVSQQGLPAKFIIDNYRPVFFVPRSTPENETLPAAERKALPLTAMDGTSVDCLYFKTLFDYRQCLRQLKSRTIKTYESDVNPCTRYLMERLITGGFSAEGTAVEQRGLSLYKNPKLRGTDCAITPAVLSFDIETNTTTGELYSIACSGATDIVFMIGDAASEKTAVSCDNEGSLLKAFLRHLAAEDPDILIGWNVINFDLVILSRRCKALGVPFEIGRDRGTILKSKKEGSRRHFINVPGRIVLDVPVMLRANQYVFDSYSLNHVAGELLGKHKSIEGTGREKIREIDRQFREDKAALARYNLLDAQLTLEIFTETNLLANAIEQSKLSGHQLDQLGGSIAAFDYLYLPRLHREGYIAGNSVDIDTFDGQLPGGYVIEPKPGIYEHVLMFDFKSLYPTIIMTFLIDPLGAIFPSEEKIVGPSGLAFSSKKPILPGIITELMKARVRAKETKNGPLSYAIKIIMNSFYGVLGSQQCRFFSPDIARAITGTGQYILKSTRTYIEESTPWSVIYGDTDSLFVLLGKGNTADPMTEGSAIVSSVNNWLKKHLKEQFNADSKLELEFETHFRHFFMPAIRGTTQGSKKRYCGTIEKNGDLILHFKGLESARTDWTELAREFQQALYKKVFLKEPVKEYILSTVTSVKKGAVDKKLVYRKQLRKPLNEYTANIPPHAQAAKLLKKPGRIIRYCITTQGPQPVEHITAPLDYEHYIDTQLQPIADSILEWIDLDFTTIVSGQQNLFDGL